MLFSSITFLFLFLPAVIILHAALPEKWRNGFLLLASAVFYAFGEMRYVPLIALLTAANWLFGRWIGAADKNRRVRTLLSVAVNIAALGYYKYIGMLPFVTEAPALPLGISFYIFQSVSYLIDVHRGEVAAEKSLRDYAAYIMLFPQLIAGPIVRYSDVAAELHRRELQPSRMESGMTAFLLGLGSKVLIANALGALYEALRALPEPGMLAAWVMLLAYGFQLYYDFHGYSLMAIGIGRMLGFEFPKNFDHPFASRSIGEFWRRWHMTLGSWLRSYVYIPLGGSRKGRTRRAVNLLITWGLSGLWHGAGLNFVAWGVYFGALIAVEALWTGRWLEKHPRIGWAYAFTAVLVSWALFSCGSMAELSSLLREMTSLRMGENVLFTLGRYLPVLLAGCVLACPRVCRLLARPLERPVVRTVLLTALLVLCTASLLRSSYNPFLYFRF